jgi:hypothetical protein
MLRGIFPVFSVLYLFSDMLATITTYATFTVASQVSRICFILPSAVGQLRMCDAYSVDTVESLQSHSILTMSHWTSVLPVCFLSQGTQVQILWGVLM